MRYRERVWTPSAPAALAVSLLDFKVHGRIFHTDEDGLIEDIYLPAAINYVEIETQRLLTSRACELRLPDFPVGYCPVELPGGAVSSITSIIADGVTVDSGNYEVVGDSPARVLALQPWPTVTGEGLPVAVAYTAGFAATPAELKVAVCQIAAEMYLRRNETSEADLRRLPLGAAHYIRQWRIMAL